MDVKTEISEIKNDYIKDTEKIVSFSGKDLVQYIFLQIKKIFNVIFNLTTDRFQVL